MLMDMLSTSINHPDVNRTGLPIPENITKLRTHPDNYGEEGSTARSKVYIRIQKVLVYVRMREKRKSG